MLEPKMMPMPEASPISPALRKEIVISETRELDCIMAVATRPKPRLRARVRVAVASTDSSTPPVKAWKPCSSASMPNMNRATPAASCMKSSLCQNPQDRIAITPNSMKLRDLFMSRRSWLGPTGIVGHSPLVASRRPFRGAIFVFICVTDEWERDDEQETSQETQSG